MLILVYEFDPTIVIGRCSDRKPKYQKAFLVTFRSHYTLDG